MAGQSVTDPSSPRSGEEPSDSDESRSEPNNDSRRLAPPPLSEIGKYGPSAGNGPDGGSERASRSEALEDPQRLRELQESLGRLEDFAAQAQAENTIWTSPGMVDVSSL